MAVLMAVRCPSANAKPSLSSPSSSSSSSSQKAFSKAQVKPNQVVLLPKSTAISLLALFAAPHDAKAVSLAKDQIVSSLTEVNKITPQFIYRDH